MYFDYETEVNRVSSVQAFERRSRFDQFAMHAKWKYLKAVLNPDWRCPYCGFLSFGHTDIELLQTGVRAGRHCCNIILEAVYAWHRHETGSLDGVRIFAWEFGFTDASDESVGCSILMRWPHSEDGHDLWRPSYDSTINIFRSGKLSL
jgi:hypothetical protein